MKIAPIPDQDKKVLVEFIEYVHAKSDIGEPALFFHEWAMLELIDNSPISKLIKKL